MHRFFLRSVVIVAGLCFLLNGLSFRLGSAPVQAQGQPPRPTLTPMPPTPVRHSDDTPPTAVPAGRITGTVIDETSGAPAPNVAVAVGEQIVLTDANGNYDRSGLPAGDYIVALALAPEQGVTGQQPIVVMLASGATIVQHLVFGSLPTFTPTPIPAAVPSGLPNTGAANGGTWGALALGMALLALGIRLRGREGRATK